MTQSAKVLPVDATFVFLSNISDEMEKRPGAAFRLPFEGLMSLTALQSADILPMEKGWKPKEEVINPPFYNLELENLITIFCNFERCQISQSHVSTDTELNVSNLLKVLPPLFDRFSGKKFAAFGFNINTLIPFEGAREYLAKHILSNAETHFGEEAFTGTIAYQFKRPDEENRLTLRISEATVTYAQDGVKAEGLSLAFNYHLQLGKTDTPSRRREFREKIDEHAGEAMRFSLKFAEKLNDR